jgi:photosystem II stability/assembly factor-like uncharacterized protein
MTTGRREKWGLVTAAASAAILLIAACPTSAAAEPKFKAIWEPVNVKEDLMLMSAAFSSREEGWVAGGRNEMSGGVILHTKDGGATWETQLGDPQSSDRAYRELRVLGPKLVLATQSTSGGDHQLLRTSDGQTWSAVGTVAQHRTDYQFVSAETGFVTGGDTIVRTQDGGRHWQPVYRCAVQAEVNGLTRNLPCEPEKLYFLNPTTGFAISRALAGGAGIVLARTEDGGSTWQPSVILPGENAKEGALYFADQNTGVLRTLDAKLFYTSDGGKSWSGSGKADGRPDMQFADPQVGWMIVYRTMYYTTNGGRNWVSREIGFPAPVTAFSLVARDRAYAVGDHGMVYRYRVVPIDYTSKGMLPAPAMPAK